MQKCPFFGKCGGCVYDFTAPDYRAQKLAQLRSDINTDNAVWAPVGARRRADFAFADGNFGFFESRSKNIVPVRNCPNLVPEINAILPHVAALPWLGAGSCLITACENGVDIAITSNVPYFSAEFKRAAESLDVLRISWNGKIIKQVATPIINFGDVAVEYPIGAFLQPTKPSEDTLRDMVVHAAHGAKKTADLFCGLGNFTFALNADGFDIAGTGMRRDLFTHPLTQGMLKQYDCVVMDPPRAGAMAQCRELAKSNVARVIYVSCNPATFSRDADILTRGGYKITTQIPVDQFVGSAHWEIFAVFEK